MLLGPACAVGLTNDLTYVPHMFRPVYNVRDAAPLALQPADTTHRQRQRQRQRQGQRAEPTTGASADGAQPIAAPVRWVQDALSRMARSMNNGEEMVRWLAAAPGLQLQSTDPDTTDRPLVVFVARTAHCGELAKSGNDTG